MNEGMGIYLHLENIKEEKVDDLLLRMDDLLLNFGIKYGGIANWYIPLDMKNRDHIMYVGEQVLKEVTWLKGIFSHVAIMNRTNTCELDQIKVRESRGTEKEAAKKEIAEKEVTEKVTSDKKKAEGVRQRDKSIEKSAVNKKDITDIELSDHLREKLQYYEAYYKRTGKLAHDIIVDEENRLVDGFTSWYLAKRYNLNVDVFQCLNGAPVKKVVRGRHVVAKDEKWKIANDKFYSWVYTLRKPVIPGDVLQVWTAKGLAYMQVEDICYVTGKEFCSQYKRVRIHTGSSMDAPDCAEVRMKE